MDKLVTRETQTEDTPVVLNRSSSGLIRSENGARQTESVVLNRSAFETGSLATLNESESKSSNSNRSTWESRSPADLNRTESRTRKSESAVLSRSNLTLPIRQVARPARNHNTSINHGFTGDDNVAFNDDMEYYHGIELLRLHKYLI